MSLSWQHCTHFYYSPLSLCLTAAAHVTHLSTRTHTYRDIWTTANQRGGPPFTISDWFRPRYKPNGGLFLNHRTGDTFFSFLEWLDAPVRPGIFVSRTREKLGCTCDQIGRTLEPCLSLSKIWLFTFSKSLSSSLSFSPSLASLYLFEQCLRLGVTSTSSICLPLQD